MSGHNRMKKPSRTLKVYKSYNFIDKDPIVDYTRTRVYANGGPAKVARESDVSPTTLYGWYRGRTRRPQFATVAAVLLACGETHINLKYLAKRG
jgi:DNA-binding phage protein